METAKRLGLLATVVVAVAIVATTLGMQTASADSVGLNEDSGSISWIMFSSVLVFAMVPGVAFFYGGMLRKQSMSSVMTQTLVASGVMTISWFVVGYSLAFGGDGLIIGSLDNLFMSGVMEDAPSGISELEFALFQGMFVILTAAIVLGACAERVRYTAVVWFLAIWSILVYVPMAHWVWGGGLFDQFLTVLDFAGGTVVHICAGITGIALVLFTGPRSDRVRQSRVHNIPLAFLGAMMLWVGWLGFTEAPVSQRMVPPCAQRWSPWQRRDAE